MNRCLTGLMALMALSTLVACQSRLPAQNGTRSDGLAIAPGALPDPPVAQTTIPTVESLWTRSAGEDWPSFLGPRGDGTSLEKGVGPELWQPHPKLRWQLRLDMSYGGPAVVKGRVLQFDRYNDHERLRVLNAETGELLWTWQDKVSYDDMYGYNNGPRCMPIVDNDLVYLYGVAGKLSCVTLADGQTVWQRDLNQEFQVVQNFFGVASAPYVWNDLVLVMVGGSPPESHKMPMGRLDMVQPNGSAIVALDKRSGKLVYRTGNDLASYSSPCVHRFGEQEVGLALARSGLLAWDASSGQELFSYPWRAKMLESVNAAQPVVIDDQILISETYAIGSTLLKFNGGQPEVIWRDGNTRGTQAFRAHWSTPVVLDGYLYGCSGRNQPDADFRCVRLSDAKVMWTERRHERASVLAVDGYLIVLYENGVLELVKPSTEKYEVVRSVDMSQLFGADEVPLLSYPCWAAPVLSHGLLYLRGNENLLCLDLIPAP